MSFTEEVIAQARPVRQRIFAHPFVTGIGDGTLDVDRFKFYIRQDYTFLIMYSRVLALAVAKAPDLEPMGHFARLLHETLDTEMALHRSYCQQFGISPQDLEATEPAPTTVAYTDFLLRTAYSGSFGELVAALLPCQWGYWEIGDILARKGMPEHAPLYAQWIRMYASPEFHALADYLRRLADNLAGSASPQERAHMAQAYITSTRYEYMFWEMSYRQTAWPV